MKKKLTSESVHTLVRWAIMIFFAYALFHSYYGPPNPAAPIDIKPAQKSAEPSQSPDCNKTDSYSLLSMPLMPLYVPYIKTEDIKKGEGEAVVCGQKVKMRYNYTVRQGEAVAKGTKDIVIGGGKELHGVELGLIGMKPGGERSIMLPSLLAVAVDPAAHIPAGAQNETVTAKVSIWDITPPIPKSQFPLRVINSGVIGNGSQVFCGDRVSAIITIWKTDGTKLFSTGDKPVTFVIGQSYLPYGIEQGVTGMFESGERIILLPPAYNKPLIDNGAGEDLLPSLPENEIVLVEIRLLHKEDLPANEKSVENKAVGKTPAANATDGILLNDSVDKTQDKEK